MKSSFFFRISLIIEIIMTLLAYWTLLRLAEWGSVPATELAVSPDAYHSISSLYLRLGAYVGICWGITGCCMVYLLSRREKDRGVVRAIHFFLVIVPAVTSIFLIQKFT